MPSNETADDLDAAIDRVFNCASSQFNDLVIAAGLDRKSDFVGANMAGLDLHLADLRGFDFSGADLRRTFLAGARVDGDTNFAGAELDHFDQAVLYVRKTGKSLPPDQLLRACAEADGSYYALIDTEIDWISVVALHAGQDNVVRSLCGLDGLQDEVKLALYRLGEASGCISRDFFHDFIEFAKAIPGLESESLRVLSVARSKLGNSDFLDKAQGELQKLVRHRQAGLTPEMKKTSDEELSCFDNDPLKFLESVLWGHRVVPDLAPVDPSQVLCILFENGGEGGVRLSALDNVLCAWLEARIQQQGQTWIEDLEDGLASALYQAFTLLPRLKLPRSASLLRDRYGEFESLAREISGENFDALLVLRIALARTQTDRSLLGWWYRQAEVAADHLDDAQMEFALAGLCGMPRMQGGAEDDLPDEALAAMVRWGRRLKAQEEGRFLAVWGRLSGHYPASPDTWAERLSPLLQSNADRPFVRWWAAAVGMEAPAPHRTGEHRKSYWRGDAPHAGITKEMLDRLRHLKGSQVDRAVEGFMRRHQAYADATGDLSNIGPAFHQVGSRVLRRRADLALRLAETALAYDRGHAPSWDLAAQALLARGRPDLAEAHYWRAMEMFDKDSAFSTRLAHMLEQQGRDLEAEALYRRAMSIDSRHVPSRHELAMLLSRRGHLAEAEAMHRETLSIVPGNDPSVTELALVLDAQGRRDEAEAVLRRAMNRPGDDPVFPAALAKLLLNWGRWEEAVALLRDAMELHPNDAPCRNTLGDALIRREEWRQYQGEVESLIRELERLDRDGARGLSSRLAARRRGEALREKVADRDALPPTPWSMLSPETIMLRAEFISRRVTQALSLAQDEVGRTWLDRLRREAEEALEEMLVRHPRHPVVQLVALRRGKIAVAALPKAGTGGYAVDLALADHAGDMNALRDLADRQKYVEAPLAWLALARRKDADAVGRLLDWSADLPGESEGAAFAHLRQRLNERFDLSKLARLPAPQRALVLGNAMTEIADDLLVKALMLYVAEELAPPVFALAA